MVAIRPESQVAKSVWTPPPWLVRWITRAQVWVYETSGGRLWTRAARMQHLLLRTVGRKSGRTITVALPFWVDERGERIVVASLGGAPRHPGWYHNLRDKRANPEVVVRDGRLVFGSDAQVLEGEERATLWKQLILDRPFYETYQRKTERVIPLVRLIEGAPR